MRRLIIADPGFAASRSLRLGPGDDVLVVGGEAPAGVGGRLVDTAPLAEAAQRAVASWALALRDSLGRAAGSDLWWFLEISEMSPMRGPLINRLYALSLVRATLAIEYGRIDVALADPLLRDAIVSGVPGAQAVAGVARLSPTAWRSRYWFRAVRFATSHLFMRLCGLAPRGARVRRGSLHFFSLYPAWWLSPIDARGRERFFPGLPPQLGGLQTQWLLWLAGGPRVLLRQRRAVREAVASGTALVIQSYVRLRDVLGLFSIPVFKRVAAMRAVGAHQFAGFDVTPLVGDAIERSIASPELPMDRLMLAGASRLLAAAGPRALVFRAEHQPFERALLRAARGTATTVGFSHSAIVKAGTYLPLQLSPSSPQPRPDRIIASGAITHRAAEEAGYTPGQVSTCGPLRQRDLLSYLAGAPSKVEARAALGLPPRGQVIVVATSVVRTDSDALLGLLPEVARRFADVTIAVQLHPAVSALHGPLDAAQQGPDGGRLLVVPSGGSHYEYLRAADVLLFAGSTIAFEAIALGAMPVAYEVPGAYSAFSMKAFDDAMFVVREPMGLFEALTEALTNAPGAARRRTAWPRLLTDVFGDLRADLDETLVRSLIDTGVIPSVS